jgi:hypothetical protein
MILWFVSVSCCEVQFSIGAGSDVSGWRRPALVFGTERSGILQFVTDGRPAHHRNSRDLVRVRHPVSHNITTATPSQQTRKLLILMEYSSRPQSTGQDDLRVEAVVRHHRKKATAVTPGRRLRDEGRPPGAATESIIWRRDQRNSRRRDSS